MENFDNSGVRRQDRLLEEERAQELLATGEHGFLAMVEERDGVQAGYGVPLNFVWDGGKSIYFHGAPLGHKLVCLDFHPLVTFCIVGMTRVAPNKFTTAYESVLVRGAICRSLPDEEKRRALELILDKYSPHDKEVGIKYALKSMPRTEILRLDITSISGKAKKVLFAD